MYKYLFTIIMLLISYSVMNAEIKYIQIKVDETPDPKLFLPITGYGLFDINDQTSNVLRVQNKRVDGYRVPIIKWKNHEVVLIGPFLDMCGDIQILDANNDLISTIKPNNFIIKGKREFKVNQFQQKINEGYVHFKISSDILRKIKTQNFKIKTGLIDNLDIVECKLVYRFDIEHISFIDEMRSSGGINYRLYAVPTKEIITNDNNRIVFNTFETNSRYGIKIKIRGDINSNDIIKFASEDLFIENNPVNSNCVPNFQVHGCQIIPNESSVLVTLETKGFMRGEKLRNSYEGYMIGMYDGNMGMASFGQGFNGMYWGPYIFARLMNSVNYNALQKPNYTDFGKVKIGECKSTWKPITFKVDNNNNPSPNNNNGTKPNSTTEPHGLKFGLMNFFTFKPSNNVQTPDYFSYEDICAFALNSNQNIETIPNIVLKIYGSSEDFIGDLNIKFSRNGSVLLQRKITNIRSLEIRDVEYRRPENRVCSTRNNALVCKRCANNQNGIPHWDDEGIEVEVIHNGYTIFSHTIIED